MSHDFRALQSRYSHLCELLAPHKPTYPNEHRVQTVRRDDGSPHIEFIDGQYHYVVTERGSEFDRRIAQDEGEVLYWLMSDVVTGIASQLELDHRVAGKDSRRQWFNKSVELLSRLDPAWGARKQSEYNEVLKLYPFRDE